jgi:hypothetical protein
LRFEVEAGQAQFCEEVNRLFSRNGVAYKLSFGGQIIRILPDAFGDLIRRSRFETGDQILDNLLEESRIKFSGADPLVRRGAWSGCGTDGNG